MAPDPNFVFNEEVFNTQVRDEVPEQFWGMFNARDIQSQGQLEAAKASVRSILDGQEKLYSKGMVPGIALKIGAEVLDPTAWAIAVASEGALAPIIFTTKAGRIGNSIRSGLTTMAATAPVEAAIAGLSDEYDAKDALIGTISAGVLGGALGAFTHRDLDAPLNEVQRQLKALEIQEAGLQLSPTGVANFKGLTDESGNVKPAATTNAEFFASRPDHRTAFAGARVDRASDNFSSASEKVRKMSGALFEDPAAAKGDLVGESAELWKQRTHGRVMQDYLRNREANLEAFRREQGRGWFRGSQTADEFAEQVTMALRGQEVASEAVRKQAQEVRRLYDEIAEMLRDPAKGEGINLARPVKGSENASLEDYVNRVWSAGKIDAMVARNGEAAVRGLIARAIRGLDAKAADTVAGHIMAIARRSRQSGLDLSGIRNHSDNLEYFLEREHGLDSSSARDIAASIKRLTEGTDAGKTGNLKHRLDIDEAMVSDLLENNIDTLFMSYANRMIGHAALARHGIDSEDTFRRLLEEAREELMRIPATSVKERSKQMREIRNLEKSYDYLVGRPVAELNPGDLPNTLARLLRKLNYSRLMNMVGVAQLAEFGVVASHTGFLAMLRNMPELAKLRRRLANGQFDDELLEELSGLMGGWADYRLLHRSHQRMEEFGTPAGEVKHSGFAKTERVLDRMNEITTDISGFNWINQVLHAYASKNMAQTFLDAARTGKRHRLSESRLRELGIDDETFKAIKAEMMKKGGAKWSESGKLIKLNLENWSPETVTKFGNAMRRWGNSVVQEGGFGSSMHFAETGIGKLLFQFKSFMLSSWTKQVLNNVKHADRVSYMMFFNSMLAGSLSYMAWVGISSVGRDDREKYLERMLATDKIAFGAFQRSSISTIFPGVIDSAAPVLGYDPLFDTRASGLQSNLITGTPSYDYAMRASQLLVDLSAVARGEEDLNQQNVRNAISLIPFQNAIGIRNGINAVIGELPRQY
jgi:hypothetical protein